MMKIKKELKTCPWGCKFMGKGNPRHSGTLPLLKQLEMKL
jgi:hypothetical protein